MFTRVVRVKDTCNILSRLALADCSEVVTFVELVKVKFVVRTWTPKAQVIRVVGIITRNWSVVSLCNHNLTTKPFSAFNTLVVVLASVATKSNLINNIRTLDFPGIAMFKPIIWNFNLLTVFYNLFENSVIISDTIAPCRNFKCSKTVNKTSGKTTKTSITKSSISLLFI